jgi:triacylglycerol lipase
MNLVLHHGFFGFAHAGDVVYFNGVADHLTAKFPGLRILVTQVAPAGGIALRGGQLGQQILQALKPGGTLDPNEAVHIIAHSMGGLDARFLLSPDNPNNMANEIKSLTTIATPHKGSPVADVLAEIKDSISNEEKALAHALSAVLAHAHIPVEGFADLTSAGCKKFNDQFRDNDSTTKFSVAGVGRGIKVFGINVDTCVALRLAYRIIKERTPAGEPNDGLVSHSSATWGDGPELWPADHADEIGHNLDLGLQARPTHFDYLAKYEALADRLQHL